MQALIDHDLVVFRCAASAEHDGLNIAIHRAEALLDELLTKTGADSYRAFLSGKSNFRKTIYPEYKANRKTTRDESALDWNEVFRILNMLRDEVKENLPYKVVQIEEAGIAIVLLAIVLDRITQSYGETLQERTAPNTKKGK